MKRDTESWVRRQLARGVNPFSASLHLVYAPLLRRRREYAYRRRHRGKVARDNGSQPAHPNQQ